MNILIIGLGSMGKRRLRLIKENFSMYEIYGVDSREDRRIQVSEEYNIQTFQEYKSLLEKIRIDAAFVCTAPLAHSEIILELLERKINVFSEINLVRNNYDKIIKNSVEEGLVCFLSSTMLYRKEIEYIKGIIKEGQNKFSYRYHVGQYLPDWHPWEKYTDFFVGNKLSNGCREILALELPWIMKTFGNIKSLNFITTKQSKLHLNYDDTYLIILEHENGNVGTLNIDVVSREAIRNLEVISENNHIFWQGKPDSLETYNLEEKRREKIILYKDFIQNNKYAANIIEDAYLEEIKEFFRGISKEINSYKYSFEEDKKIIKIIDKIEGVDTSEI